MDKVTMAVGSGGKATNEFIKKLILSKFGNSKLNNLGDAAYLKIDADVAFTTDSFVVEPEFFKGGDIGELAVYGTCNDLAVSGAKPLYLSLSLIIPEGYEIEKLDRILDSVKCAAEDVGVEIVCGDTKVVGQGALTGIILNTAGVGAIQHKLNSFSDIAVGDKVILTSDIARHGMAVMVARGDLGVESAIDSDCGNLYEIFNRAGYDGISFARDATRGGVAAVLHEIMEMSGKGALIDEAQLPIKSSVAYLCELLGFDPLSVANEGVAVIVVKPEIANELLDNVRLSNMGKGAVIVGEITMDEKLVMKTKIGGHRFVEMPTGELLPRIC